MKRVKITVTLIAFGVVLTACASPNPPPTTPPEYDGTYPAITEGRYATYKTERVFDAPLVPLREFIGDGNKIVAAMEETENIKKPIDVKVLSGTWPEEGSVRRLKFSDGHYAMERVVDNDFPEIFRYQVWGYTSAAGNNLDYAVGQQAWEVLPSGQSRLVWTYSLRPNAAYKQFFVQRFVNNDMRPLMNTALDTVRKQANAAFTDTEE